MIGTIIGLSISLPIIFCLGLRVIFWPPKPSCPDEDSSGVWA